MTPNADETAETIQGLQAAVAFLLLDRNGGEFGDDGKITLKLEPDDKKRAKAEAESVIRNGVGTVLNGIFSNQSPDEIMKALQAQTDGALKLEATEDGVSVVVGED